MPWLRSLVLRRVVLFALVFSVMAVAPILPAFAEGVIPLPDPGDPGSF